MSTRSSEQRQAMEANGHVAIDDGAYVVVKASVYDRLRSLLETSHLSLKEQRAMIAHIGQRAGWDDRRMDIYDNLDPHRDR